MPPHPPAHRSEHAPRRITCCIRSHTLPILEIRETKAHVRWFGKIPDPRARERILTQVRRLSFGNPGDARPVGEGFSELLIDYRRGYRVYYAQRGESQASQVAGLPTEYSHPHRRDRGCWAVPRRTTP